MLRARWYKVINDLFGNKTRTLLIVLSMSVGLFALGIILSARDSVQWTGGKFRRHQPIQRNRADG